MEDIVMNTSNTTNYKQKDLWLNSLGVSVKTLQALDREGILESKSNSNW